MAARRARRASGTAWWTVALLVVAAAVALWWLRARRAEAPALPASIPGARALSNPPGAVGSHPGEEHISPDDKDALQRVLREHAAPSEH